MHPRQVFSLRDDCPLEGGELAKPPMDFRFVGEPFRQTNIGGMMASLGFEQAVIETASSSSLTCFRSKSNRSQDRASISPAISNRSTPRSGSVFLTSSCSRLPYWLGFKLPKTDPATFEERQNLVKMIELFLDDLGHRLAKRAVFDVSKEEIHRRGGSLLLTMRMVDQNLF
jgi:hypothetical protein